MIILIILIILTILYVIARRNNYPITYDFITFFEGGEGSGKTTMLTHLTLKEFHKRLRQNIFIKIRNKLLFFTKKKPYANTKVYSDYPIYLGKKYGYSYVLTDEFITWKKILDEGSLAVCDEMGLFFPMETKKTEQTKIFTMTYLRHIMDKDPNGNNARIFASSQSMTEVNITFRRKCNKCYELTGMRKGLSLLGNAKVNIMQVYLSESINNQYIDDDMKRNVYKFRYPKGAFSSTYGKDFKSIPKKSLDYVATSYANLMEYYGYKFGDKWRELEIKH